MLYLQVLCTCLWSLLALSSAGDCPYVAKINKYGPCAGNKKEFITLEKISIKFVGEDCKMIINGCANTKEKLSEINIKYKAYKDSFLAKTGSKEGCGAQMGKLQLKCPLQAGKVCSGDMTMKLPGGEPTLKMIKGGVLKIQADVITNAGTMCFEGTGELKNK